MEIILTILVALAMFVTNTQHDYFKSSFLFLSLFMVMPIIKELYIRYSFKISALFSLVIFSSFYGVWADGRGYSDLGVRINNFLEFRSATTCIIVLLSAIFLVKYRDLKKFLDYFCVANTCYIIWSYIFRDNWICGFSNNIGIDSIILASWIPAMFFRKESTVKEFAPLCVMVVMASEVVTANIGLIVGMLYYLFINLNKKGKIILSSVSIFALLVLVMNINYFEDGLRFKNWSYFLEYIENNLDLVSGTGAGSFWVFGPLIQKDHFTGKFQGYIFAHNEFIQVLIEYGVAVFILFLLCIKDILFKKIPNYLKASSIIFIFSFMTFPIIRYYPGLIYGLILLREIYANEPTSKRKIFNIS